MFNAKKVDSVNLAKKILEKDAIIIVQYKGVTSQEMNDLRISLKDKNANIKILKNNLVKKAIGDSDYAFLKDYLTEQVAISYGEDAIALANILINCAKDNEKLKIQAGCLNGKIIDFAAIEALAKLGSVDDVRARFVSVLKAAGSKLVRVFDAYCKKQA